MIKAKWIWKKQKKQKVYNQTIIAKKEFQLKRFSSAKIKITADAYYRLYLNGIWVNDGPCRSWPEHYQYDEIDVTPYLKDGKNEIRIIARHYGIGDFHHVPQKPGLLAELELQTSQKRQIIATNKTWRVTIAPAWISNTPKVSCQMEPQEMYDARKENNLRWQPAMEICNPDDGPWKDLNSRDVALLSRTPRMFGRFSCAQLVERPDTCYHQTVPIGQLLHPGALAANCNVSRACAMATILELPKKSQVTFRSSVFNFAVNGCKIKNEVFNLPKGRHLIFAFTPTAIWDHRDNDAYFYIKIPNQKCLTNPKRKSHSNPWCFLEFPESHFKADDTFYPYGKLPALKNIDKDWKHRLGELLHSATIEKFSNKLSKFARCLPHDQMFSIETYDGFENRKPLRECRELVEQPVALMSDNPDVTVVNPSSEGDIELLYDLGTQSVGYWDLELNAPEGVQVDFSALEYFYPDGTPQHTGDNRNGFRYITKQGWNRFTSLKRRGGRYLFITLRNQSSPIHIRQICCIESVYPANLQANFECNDQVLNALWKISDRTMRLTMQDTLVDCPLYEQTHWVVKNSYRYMLCAYSAQDITARCLRLAAQSLEHLPLIGTQMPSSWNVILPLSTFYWVESLWEYTYHTGQTDLVNELWPALAQNMKNCEKFMDKNGLFSGPFWNIIDGYPPGSKWEPETLLSNNLIYLMSLNAAVCITKLIGKTKESQIYEARAKKLCRILRNCWDSNKMAFPDIFENDASGDFFSPDTCAYSILSGVASSEKAKLLGNYLVKTPKWMSPIRTPMTLHVACEALEKLGRLDDLLELMCRELKPMLELGASTFWEALPGIDKKRPTRSHCHCFSPLPIYFFPRIILGIKPIQLGGTNFEISPWITEGLQWAKGAFATVYGPVKVLWHRKGRILHVEISAPKETQCCFKRNSSMKGMKIQYKDKV